MIIATSTFHIGAVCFGVVNGWNEDRQLRRGIPPRSRYRIRCWRLAAGRDPKEIVWCSVGGRLCVYCRVGPVRRDAKWMGGAEVTERVVVERHPVDNP